MSANSKLEKLKYSPTLPSPPQIAMQLLEFDRDPDAGIQELSAIVEADPAISAQILKFANSPLAGLSGEVTSTRQAVVLIGCAKTRLIALSFSLIKSMKKAQDFDITGYWQTCIAIGVAAKSLSKDRFGDPDLAFTAGLMSKLGLIIIQTADNETFKTNFADLNCESARQNKAREIYGESLYEIAADILDSWGFPEAIHSIIRDAGTEPKPTTETGKFLRLANLIANMLIESQESVSVEDARTDFSDLKKAVGERANLGLEDIFEEVSEAFSKYLKLMEIEVPVVRELWKVELEAREKLIQLSMDAQGQCERLAQENVTLRSESQTDQLTGLRNRKAFEDRAIEEIDRAERLGFGFAMMVIDIDRFKSFNDTHGHLVGDAVLKAVGNRLSEVNRKYDSAYRYGGEEFTIIVPECELDDIPKIGERVRESIESLDVHCEGKTLSVTVSIGVTYFDGRRSATWQDLFEEADKELYRAKMQGRNQVCYAGSQSIIVEKPAKPAKPSFLGAQNSSSILTPMILVLASQIC